MCMKQNWHKKTSLLWLLCVLVLPATAQNYHATNGSDYAGVMGIYNNPASSVGAKAKWDLNLLSVQISNANSIAEQRDPHVFNLDTAAFQFKQGYGKRNFTNIVNVDIANFRYKINSHNAFSIGLRAKSYSQLQTSAINYQDTLYNFNKFLKYNPYTDLAFSLSHALWAEAYVNYANMLVDNDFYQWSVGATLSFGRSLSGGFMQGSQMSFSEVNFNQNLYGFYMTRGDFSAMYSSNYDLLTNDGYQRKSAVDSFFKQTHRNTSLSFGMEWVIKQQPDFYSVGSQPTGEYSWKLGVSILDIGRNTFTPTNGAFHVTHPQLKATTVNLEDQFGNYTDLRKFRDSLALYFGQIDSLKTPFYVAMPTRMLLSVDKNLGSHFFVNAQASINFNKAMNRAQGASRELTFLTVTPRWETRNWGIFFPMQYNNSGQFWVGAAAKLGPLLVGVHRLSLLTGQLHAGNTGGYVALHYTPKPPKAPKTWYDCP